MESLNPEIKLYDKRDFSEVLNAGFGFLRENAKGIFKNVFAVAAPFALLALILQLVYTSQLMDTVSGIGSSTTPNLLVDDFSAIMVLSQLTSNLLVLICTLAMLSYVKLYYVKGPQNITLAEVWQETLSHFGRGLGVSILYGLAVVFALFLLLIPGIYLAILWSLYLPLIVFENLGTGALSRSSQLLKGNWWRTFALLLVTGIIVGLISGAFSLPLIIITGVKSYFATTEGQLVDTLGTYGVLNILASIIAFFGTIVSYVIFASVTAFYMGTLVEEQESRGLMADINADPASEKPAADSHEQY